MKEILVPLILTMAFIVGVGLFSNGKIPGINPETPKATLEVSKKTVTVSGNVIDVEVVDNEISRKKGLGERNSLEKNGGMLFVFDNENITPSFWMKDMNFAIDIIWINDGKVAQISENILPPEKNTPDSKLKFYTTNQPIDYVLEVNGGFSKKNNINVGNIVELP